MNQALTFETHPELVAAAMEGRLRLVHGHCRQNGWMRHIWDQNRVLCGNRSYHRPVHPPKFDDRHETSGLLIYGYLCEKCRNVWEEKNPPRLVASRVEREE